MRKFLLITLAVLVSFVGVASWLLSDANRFKPQLVDLIQSRTGLSVVIRGDLKWRLWPPLQLVAQDVTAHWAADATKPTLAARTLSLDADVWPLLSKNPRLAIQGAQLSGAVIDYVVADEPMQIDIDALQIKDIAPTRRFALHAKLTIKNVVHEIPLTIVAKLTFDEAVTQWQLDDIDINGVYGNPGLPFQLKASAHVNTVAGTADLANAHLDVGKITATFDIAAVDLLTTPQYSGHLDLPQQSLDSVTGLLGTQLDVPVGLKTALTATAERIDLIDAELRYGPSLITGKIGTPIAKKLNIGFDLATDRFVVPSNKTTIATLGGGSFAALAFAAPSVVLDPSPDEPILPLDLMRTADWNGKVVITQLVQEGATFQNSTITSSNEAGIVSATIDLPDFFGGTATTRLKIDVNSNAPQWNIAPTLNHVDSQAMLEWLGDKYDWVATFLAGGEFSMRGNTRRELIATLIGHTTFDGGQGVINIRQIKNAALGIAKIAGGTDKIGTWPDRLNYQRFTGTWDANGTQQMIDVALDNLTLKAKGTVDTLADDMDLRATVTVNDDPKYKSFKMSSALMGLPLPIHCKGSIASLRCGGDEDGTRQLIAHALSGEDPEMRERLDKAIDEKVPPQYRDAARSLLEMLNKGNHQQPKSP